MEIKITYVGTLNGVNGIWCGFKPKGIIITEKREVLYADDDKYLVRISDGENVGQSIWLNNGDIKENYREEENPPEVK